MTWDGFPLYYSQKHGWGYLVPGRKDNLTPYEHEQLEGTSEKHKIESDSADNPFPTKYALMHFYSHGSISILIGIFWKST